MRCSTRLLPETDVLWHVLKPLHGRDDRRGAAAAADPEDRRRRQHDRPGRGKGARHCGVQPARHQCARGGGTDTGADAGDATPPAALRRGDARGEWSDPLLQDGLGELGGRIVGLVGYGAIPRLLAPVLAALGCRLIYTARAQHADALGEWRSSPALLEEADVVSLHLPLTGETANLIDAAATGAHEARRGADQHRARRPGGPGGADRSAG